MLGEIPKALFREMLKQAKAELGEKPLVNNIDDHEITIGCQGGQKVDIHFTSLYLRGELYEDMDTAVAWLHDHPVLEDTIQFQASGVQAGQVNQVNRAHLTQTVLDAACAKAGCKNGASCALKRSHTEVKEAPFYSNSEKPSSEPE